MVSVKKLYDRRGAMNSQDVERLFREDIRDKRKAGSGSFHKRGKGVKHGISGALKTPYHYMTTKEKKKLNGEVKVSFMYETVIPMREFKLKDEETQRAMLIRWRELFENKHIIKEMGIGNNTLYGLIEELNLPKKPRGGTRAGAGKRIAKQKALKAVSISPEKEVEEIEKVEKKEIETEVIKTSLVTKGLHLEYNGEFDIEALNRLFTKLQLMIDGETCKYNISLYLSEVHKD